MTTHPYQDPTLSIAQRVEDLMSRMSLEDKVGLMFQTIVPMGDPAVATPILGLPSPLSMITERRMNHFNLVGSPSSGRGFAEWHNALQKIAADEAAGHTRHPLHRPAPFVQRQSRGGDGGRTLFPMAGTAGACRDRFRSRCRTIRRHCAARISCSRVARRPSPADRPGDRAPLVPDQRDLRRRRGPHPRAWLSPTYARIFRAINSALNRWRPMVKHFPRRRAAEGRRKTRISRMAASRSIRETISSTTSSPSRRPSRRADRR